MLGRRVVVTGLGMVTPLGNTVASTWEGILAAKSGIATIEHFDATPFTTQFAGNIRGLDIEQYMPLKDARKMDAFIQYGLVASMQAVEDSGFVVTEENADRCGSAIGSGIGGIGAIEENRDLINTKGPRRISPFFVPGSIINMVAGNLAIKYGLRGPNIAVTTACTTGTHNIGLAARMIALGEADMMVAGGAEMACTPVGLGGFAAARALSTRNDAPTTASRPWDKDRDGFVLADGAGIVVLEEYESAKGRGAKIYAELCGFGTVSYTHLNNVMRWRIQNIFFVQQHFSGICLIQAGNNIEQRSFTRAVGADYAIDTFFWHRKGNIVQCLQAAKALADIAHFQ